MRLEGALYGELTVEKICLDKRCSILNSGITI
jgi:hypothetical protein